MYQALYRKWRPQTFDEVIGQQHITETLKNQVRTGRLSHAYLFIGTRGTGKTTCARILAKAVNCEHPADGNPCGVCPACRGIAEGSVLDVVELDAASNNSVDNVRALREEAVFTPAAVRRRVYIIDEVHMLSGAAFNALLKILEEPPAHLMFILATTELQKVPATILSRCQRHSFKRIETPVIAAYLEQIAQREKLSLSREAAELIAGLSDGGVRDALSLLDQCSANERIDLDAVYAAMGLAGGFRTAAMLEAVLAHDAGRVLGDFDTMWMDGKDPGVMLTELLGLLRDILMVQVAPKGGASLLSGVYTGESLRAFAARTTREELLCAMETLQDTLAQMRLSADPKTAAELCLVSLCDNTLAESLPALRARISRLERQLEGGVPVKSAPPREQAHEDTPPPPEEEFPAPAPPARQESGEPEDELDPAMFEEEQPEDSFLRRGDKPGGAPAAAPLAAAPDWEAVCAKASAALPGDVRAQLSDTANVSGRVEGDILRIEVATDFLYGRFNRQEVLAKFSDAASALAGRELRAVAVRREDQGEPRRSLEELRGFSEVRFI